MGMNFEERSALAQKPYRESIPFGGCDAKERLELFDRIDAAYETALGRSVPLKEKPSFY
jgi:hypothetical protein